MPTFFSCESAFSYALRRVYVYDWKQPLKIDDMLLSTFSAEKIHAQEYSSPGMVDSTQCTRPTNDTVSLAVTKSYIRS